MGRDVGIADRLRAHGLTVVEVAGWQTRGSSDFSPQGAVMHHTAGPPTGTAPSLGVVVNGRPDLAGPLCNVLQSREPSGVDAAYVVAAGTANHAGKGGWRGLAYNHSVWGLEIEHTGTTDLPVARQQQAARILAALVDGTTDADMVCQHREWAPDRKIDAAENVNPDRVRSWVADALRAPTPTPGGALVSALTVRYPVGKAGPIVGGPVAGRFAYYTHDDTHVYGWNSAALSGDRAHGGTDQDSIDGRVPRVVDVPVSAGARLIGLAFATTAAGGVDPSIVVACSSDGGTYAYTAT